MMKRLAGMIAGVILFASAFVLLAPGPVLWRLGVDNLADEAMATARQADSCIWLERIDDGNRENWIVWQRPLGDDPYSLVGWGFRRQTGPNEPWDFNAAMFARCAMYSEVVAYDDPNLTIHDATTGGTWSQVTVGGEDFNKCEPTAGYDASTDPAYIEFAIPAGVRAVAVQFRAASTAGLFTATIDGATDLVNGDYLASDGTLDTYKAVSDEVFGGRFRYVAMVARDLPTTSSHVLRITVTGLNSHDTDKHNVYIGQLWMITRPGRPGGTGVVWADAKTIQAGLWTEASDLASLKENDGNECGGWSHGGLTNQSVDTLTLDDANRLDDSSGTITEGDEAYIEYSCDMDPGAGKLADVTYKLRFRGNWAAIEATITFARDYAGSSYWAYGPQFSVSFCNEQTAYQYPRNFWRGAVHDWGPGTTAVAANVADDPATTPMQFRLWRPGVLGMVHYTQQMDPAPTDVKRTTAKDYWQWPASATAADVWTYHREIELYGGKPTAFAGFEAR